MSDAHETTAALSKQLATKSVEFADLAEARANLEVTYKVARAKRILVAKSEGAKSIAEAETIATADDGVAELWREFLSADAVADACGKSMMALRTRIDYGRSVIATERAADSLHSQGYSGAA